MEPSYKNYSPSSSPSIKEKKGKCGPLQVIERNESYGNLGSKRSFSSVFYKPIGGLSQEDLASVQNTQDKPFLLEKLYEKYSFGRQEPQGSVDPPPIVKRDNEVPMYSPPRPKSLLDLPTEILKMIIYHIYSSGSSIIPIITCSREIYENFAYLIYMTKVVVIDNDMRMFKDGGYCANKRLKFIDKHQSTVATQITVLTMKSNIPLGGFKSEISPNSEFFLRILPKMRNLVVLTVESDEHALLFRALCNLPPNLQVLRLYLKLTKRHLSKINGPLVPDDDYKKLSFVSTLQFFDFDSKKVTMDLMRHGHPELGGHEPFNSQAAHRFIRPSVRSSIGNLITQLKGGDDTFSTKSKIGELIYEFILKNRYSLIKVELAGIDMSLILSRIAHRFPFQFPRLRMLFFDTITRDTLSDWVHMFHEVNKIPTYKNQLPLMMYYDRLSQRIYYKDTRYHYDSNDEGNQRDPCDLKTWSHSEQVATAYALLNKSRNIKY